jgi:myxalamid-type polyketide synthase MxaE and MxaD
VSTQADEQLRRALRSITELRSRLEALERARAEPIAVVGMACRFPGARDLGTFWRLLADGVDAISEVPRERWDIDSLYDADADAPGKIASRWGGFIDDVGAFDPYFFGIAPREAAAMDPQQRLLLEVAWEALEASGQSGEGLAGSRTGVFVGVHSHSTDYCTLQYAHPDRMDAYTGTGSSLSIAAGRLAYLFDLRGPAITIDTACSSSLVAVHLACQSLRAGESSRALAAGVNLILSPLFTIAASRMRMLAPDGRCKTFDAAADGFVRAEGCGVVVLKRLADARAAGDPILAVIRGSAMNQDGKTNGLTAPSGVAQQAVIREALRQAAVEPAEIDYVEAHGTGTPLGDPIEVEALAEVLGPPSAVAGPCLLGSVKTNVGHLEGAAGIAGLMKVVLALHHEAVPPHLHLSRLNPNVVLDGTRLRIPGALEPWPRRERRRCAGVSSFGWSGTNVHVVLEEAPAPAPAAPAVASPCLLPVSARSPEALAAMVSRYERFLADPAAPALADVCHTAALRRRHHPHRAAVVGRSAAEIAERLAVLGRGEAGAGTATGRVPTAAARPRVAFVFSGQGSQWLGMGRRLLDEEPVFREALERCDTAIGRHAAWSLLAELRAAPQASRLAEIDVVQPTLFAVAVALAALWRSWGIEPDAVIGHSMGEVAAAHVAGTLDLDDAARIICRRSALLRRVRGRGAMAVIDLPRAAVEAELSGHRDRLSVAVLSSPRATVVSGDPAALDEVLGALRDRDVFCRRINVDVASHSPQVDPLLPELREILAGIAPRDGAVPFFSTVLGRRCAGRELDAGYWVRNLREPVLFSPTLESLAGAGSTDFVELSPHPLLASAIAETLEARGGDGQVLPSLRRDEDERGALLGTAGALWTTGHPLRWDRVAPPAGRCVTLPAYAWQHERYWLADDAAAAPPPRRPAAGEHPLLGARIELADQPERRVWELSLDAASAPGRYHHRIGATTLLAAAAHVGLVLAAAREALGAGPLVLRDVEFRQALVIPETGGVLAQVSAVPDGERVRVSVFGRTASTWVCHATATAERQPPPPPADVAPAAAGAGALEGAALYERLAQGGIGIAPPLRRIGRAWGSETAAGAVLAVDEDAGPWAEVAAIDVGFQLPALVGAGAAVRALPTRVDEIRVHGQARRATRVETRRRAAATAAVDVHDARLVGDDGRAEVELSGLHVVAVPSALGAPAGAVEPPLYEIQWRRASAPGRATLAGRWAVLAADAPLTGAVTRALESRGARSVVVEPGAGYANPAADRFVVDPAVPADLAKALAAVATPGQPLTGVVSLWALRGARDGDDVLAPCREALAVLHALTGAPAPARLWLVTRGAQPVGAPRPLALSQSPLWGLGRVIAEEHPDLWGGLVDLDPAGAVADEAARLVDTLAGGDGEDRVAYRDGRRHVARLARAESGDPVPAFACRADATYLITGGLGALGAEVAGFLVERGARHLVLVSRTALPPRDRWDDAGIVAAARPRIAAVRALERAGARVRVAAVDVGDDAQVAGLLAGIAADGPPLRGVVHAAAAIEDRLLARLDPASLERVWRGKAGGAWVLHRRLAAVPLDFLVLFSSLGSVLGQSGQGSYATANAFLDALAHHRRAEGLPAVSVNWAAWGELGFAGTEGGRRVIADLERHGIHAFTPAQALDVLARALARPAPQVVAAAVDWARYGTLTGARVPPFLADLVGPTAAGAVTPDAELGALPLPERRARLEERVRADVAQVLKLPASKVEPRVPLGTLGLDSLTGLELRRRLERRVGRPLPATLAWNYPTVADLAGYLAGLAEDGGATRPAEAAPARPAPAAGAVASLTEDEALRALVATRRRP